MFVLPKTPAFKSPAIVRILFPGWTLIFKKSLGYKDPYSFPSILIIALVPPSTNPPVLFKYIFASVEDGAFSCETSLTPVDEQDCSNVSAKPKNKIPKKFFHLI